MKDKFGRIPPDEPRLHNPPRDELVEGSMIDGDPVGRAQLELARQRERAAYGDEYLARVQRERPGADRGALHYVIGAGLAAVLLVGWAFWHWLA